MTVIFKAKTTDGYSIKILLELLQNNLKLALFNINSEGIFLRMFDSGRKILVDLALKSTKFNFYKFKSEEKNLYIGVNPNNFYKMIKAIKRKDSLVLKITDKNPTNLFIQIIPKENPTRVSESIVKFQNSQNIETDLPLGYKRPINVPSIDFQKACKEVAIGRNLINVSTTDLQIKFLCDGGGLCYKSITFGENDNSDSEDELEDDENNYNQDFDSEQLQRITKISSLSSDLQIFATYDLPILFKSRVGNVGKISIFLRSKQQIEKDDEED